jgi:hypothetical protein
MHHIPATHYGILEQNRPDTALEEAAEHALVLYFEAHPHAWEQH